jgi:hypothetical protein
LCCQSPVNAGQSVMYSILQTYGFALFPRPSG